MDGIGNEVKGRQKSRNGVPTHAKSEGGLGFWDPEKRSRNSDTESCRIAVLKQFIYFALLFFNLFPTLSFHLIFLSFSKMFGRWDGMEWHGISQYFMLLGLGRLLPGWVGSD